jgi:hypothetical protein
MAVWDLPSPIALAGKFKLKVGVGCSARCKLDGTIVEVRDQEGRALATTTLGAAPWPGTDNLYWSELELTAPGTEGRFRWLAALTKPRPDLAHEAASSAFEFVTVRRPEYVITVEAFDRDKKRPISNARVVSLPYRNHTDASGVARLGVAGGEYELYVAKGEYRTFETVVKVTGDMTVRAELIPDPTIDNGR